MKIAICYSGLYRTYNGWIENHKNNLPKGDYFYSTWESQRKYVDINNVKFYRDPDVKYNLYLGSFAEEYGSHIQFKEEKRLYTAANQHIGHWKISKEIKDNYDIIIRMRYDTFLGDHSKEISDLCEICYSTGKAIGIGNANSVDDNNKSIHNNKFKEFKTKTNYMLDFMNIHRSDKISNVDELIEKKEMYPTNAGWWLILSKFWNGHINYRGGIQLARNIGIKIKQ